MRFLRIRSARVLTAIVLAGAMSGPLSAHHGWGGYSTKEFELTGTVDTPVSLAGPHALMKIKVGTDVWTLTLAPPARVTAAGLKENTIPVGATVTIHGHRNVNQKILEVKTERIVYNGKTFNVYPDRT
jgi:hypothetical protein